MKKLFLLSIFVVVLSNVSFAQIATVTTPTGEKIELELTKVQMINLVIDKKIKSRQNSNFEFMGKNVSVSYSGEYSLVIDNSSVSSSKQVTQIRKDAKLFFKK
jgi:hypothetical protein